MHLAIVTGGRGTERNVSLASAKNVQRALKEEKTEVYVFPEDLNRFLESRTQISCVIPVMHGEGGEDGELQGFLQTLGIPYLFSGMEAHMLGMDKKQAKRLAQLNGLRVAKSYTQKDAVFPVFVKPRRGGSSIQTGRVKNQEELNVFLKEAKEEMLIEQCITGSEFTVGVIEDEDGNVQALPVTEIRPKGEFFDYQSKYNEAELAEEICPANISEQLAQELQRQAVKIHEELGARHLSRSDFIVTEKEEIYFLEINTIPGMTDTSLVPKALREVGISLTRAMEGWLNRG